MRPKSVLTLALVLWGSGCTSLYRQHRVLIVEGLPFEQVWAACIETAGTRYALDPLQADRGLKQLTTRWYERLRAFGKGSRARAHFEVKSRERDKHEVHFYVEREKHGNIAAPLHPSEADWYFAGQDAAAETFLMYQLQSRIARLKQEMAPSVEGVRMQDPMKRTLDRK
ncbi:MAG: hypothetical protein ACE5F1_10165 [Planctomycetota bacterium]